MTAFVLRIEQVVDDAPDQLETALLQLALLPPAFTLCTQLELLHPQPAGLRLWPLAPQVLACAERYREGALQIMLTSRLQRLGLNKQCRFEGAPSYDVGNVVAIFVGLTLHPINRDGRSTFLGQAPREELEDFDVRTRAVDSVDFAEVATTGGEYLVFLAKRQKAFVHSLLHVFVATGGESSNERIQAVQSRNEFAGRQVSDPVLGGMVQLAGGPAELTRRLAAQPKEIAPGLVSRHEVSWWEAREAAAEGDVMVCPLDEVPKRPGALAFATVGAWQESLPALVAASGRLSIREVTVWLSHVDQLRVDIAARMMSLPPVVIRGLVAELAVQSLIGPVAAGDAFDRQVGLVLELVAAPPQFDTLLFPREGTRLPVFPGCEPLQPLEAAPLSFARLLLAVTSDCRLFSDSMSVVEIVPLLMPTGELVGRRSQRYVTVYNLFADVEGCFARPAAVAARIRDLPTLVAQLEALEGAGG